MAEERGDSRFSSFLVGFLIGSLVVGGGATGYFVWQEYLLTRDAMIQRAHAYRVRLQAEAARHQAEATREAADKERRRAEEALKQLQEN